MAAKTVDGRTIVAENRKARHEYFVTDTWEAGIMLTGTEVKSLRKGQSNIAESYASPEGDGLWLINSYIAEHKSSGSFFQHEVRRKRKLLLHKSEIHKMVHAVERKGMTIVPLELYFNEKGRAKLKLGLAEGKQLHDKRETDKKRDPAPTGDGGAAHLVAGLALPDVALVSTLGVEINLRDVLGRAVVFIYPWTGRPGLSNPPDWDAIPGAHGSTPQAEGFRDCFAQFQALNLSIFGLSSQASDHQHELASRLNLPFPMLSDANFAFADALRLPRFATGSVTYLKRLTLITSNGHIERVVYPVHPPDTHAKALISMFG
jgi:SsrA-binding protein